jgi:hypothetical protein
LDVMLDKLLFVLKTSIFSLKAYYRINKAGDVTEFNRLLIKRS